MTVAGLVLAVLVALRGSDGLGLGGRIALIEIDGVIVDDREVLEDIRRFRRDPSVRGYLLAINSPGGAVGPSQSIFEEVRRLRVEDGAPVIASIGSVGASGGYYIALAADTIFALPGSMTGSIGVILEVPNVRGLMDKVGVDVQVVKSSEHKDIGSPFRSMSEEDRALMNVLIQDVYEQFVGAVVEERGLPAAEVRQVADGRVITGRQARAQGLVDRLGNLHAAAATAGRMAGLGERPRLVRPPEERVTLLDVLLGRAPVSLGRLVEPLLGEVAIWPRLRFIVN